MTSAAWTAMHIQYDAIQLTQVLLIGLLLGWLRWASGSTLLTIAAAHADKPRRLHPDGDQGGVDGLSVD